MGKWKGLKQGLVRKPNAPLELYDLDADIGEKTNVAAKYPDVAAKIEQIMLDAREKPTIGKFRFGKYRD
jgi:hypothetical protein